MGRKLEFLGGPVDGRVWEGPFQWELTMVEVGPVKKMVTPDGCGKRHHGIVELVHRYRLELVDGKAVYRYKGVM